MFILVSDVIFFVYFRYEYYRGGLWRYLHMNNGNTYELSMYFMCRLIG